jgi:hypothetical protein
MATDDKAPKTSTPKDPSPKDPPSIDAQPTTIRPNSTVKEYGGRVDEDDRMERHEAVRFGDRSGTAAAPEDLRPPDPAGAD